MLSTQYFQYAMMNKDIKKIAVVGATGKAGRAVVKEAIAKGYEVVAVVRKPGSVQPATGLEVQQADVMDTASLAGVFKNVDAVISCLGPAKNLQPGKVMSEGTRNMVEACAVAEVKRFVMLSGILQADGIGLSFLDKSAVGFFRLIYRKVVKDKLIGEQIIQQSRINWVIVHATGLSDKPPTGHYIAGPHAGISLARPITVSDCAACLVRALKEHYWTRQNINVGV